MYHRFDGSSSQLLAEIMCDMPAVVAYGILSGDYIFISSQDISLYQQYKVPTLPDGQPFTLRSVAAEATGERRNVGLLKRNTDK